MTHTRESRKIAAAIVGLGNSLSLTTVAEGIEDQTIADMLLWLGCDIGQGLALRPTRPRPSSFMKLCRNDSIHPRRPPLSCAPEPPTPACPFASKLSPPSASPSSTQSMMVPPSAFASSIAI